MNNDIYGQNTYSQSLNRRQVVVDKQGNLLPVKIKLKGLKIISSQTVRTDDLVHNENSYKGTDPAVIKFLYDKDSPEYIVTKENEATIHIAKKLVPILEKCFGNLYPRDFDMSNFEIGFIHGLFNHVLYQYPEGTDEQLATVEKQLRPLWDSNEPTTPIEEYRLPTLPRGVRGNIITVLYKHKDRWRTYNTSNTLANMKGDIFTIPPFIVGTVIIVSSYARPDRGFVDLRISRHIKSKDTVTNAIERIPSLFISSMCKLSNTDPTTVTCWFTEDKNIGLTVTEQHSGVELKLLGSANNAPTTLLVDKDAFINRTGSLYMLLNILTRINDHINPSSRWGALLYNFAAEHHNYLPNGSYRYPLHLTQDEETDITIPKATVPLSGGVLIKYYTVASIGCYLTQCELPEGKIVTFCTKHQLTNSQALAALDLNK